MKVRIVTVRLSTEIRPHEVGLFRGAVNKALGEERSILFHNHDGDGFRYSYPLIQYKRIGGKAAIVALGEGSEAICQFFERPMVELEIGDRKVSCEVEEVLAKVFDVELTDEPSSYRMRKWLPLNEKNFQEYKSLDSLVEKYMFLENILTGNILSFCKGIGLFLEGRVEVKLKDVIDEKLIRYKGNRLMSFDVDFSANVSLPDFIGLGKGASIGHGTTTKYEQKERRVI